MLMVIKRLGGEQAFDVEKIRISVAAASDEIGQPMVAADTKRIADTVYRKFSGLKTVASAEVRGAVIEALKDGGYGAVAASFENGPAEGRQP